jgi:hypothetical protein
MSHKEFKYFVVWQGDLSVDPLNKGVKPCYSRNEANEFIEKFRNKGLHVFLYEGKYVFGIWDSEEQKRKEENQRW